MASGGFDAGAMPLHQLLGREFSPEMEATVSHPKMHTIAAIGIPKGDIKICQGNSASNISLPQIKAPKRLLASNLFKWYTSDAVIQYSSIETTFTNKLPFVTSSSTAPRSW